MDAVKMPLMITDYETTDADIVKLARAKEFKDRAETMHDLLVAQTVAVVSDNDAEYITVRVGDEEFRDKRYLFPTTELMARVQLALHAGMKCEPSAFDAAPLFWEDSRHYAQVPHYRSAEADCLTSLMYENLTATVNPKPKRPSKRQRGLRP